MPPEGPRVAYAHAPRPRAWPRLGVEGILHIEHAKPAVEERPQNDVLGVPVIRPPQHRRRNREPEQPTKFELMINLKTAKTLDGDAGWLSPLLKSSGRSVPKLCPTQAHSGALQYTPAHDAVGTFCFDVKHLRTLPRTRV